MYFLMVIKFPLREFKQTACIFPSKLLSFRALNLEPNMNKLLLSFGLLTSAISSAVLSASDAAEEQRIEFPFEYSWSGSEDELFFNIEVPEGFSFPETFSILTTQNGQGAEITCLSN